MWPVRPHDLYSGEGDDYVSPSEGSRRRQIEAEVKARDRDTCAITGLRSNICRAVRIAPPDAEEAHASAKVHNSHITSWITMSPDLGAFFAQGDIALQPVSLPAPAEVALTARCSGTSS